MAGCARVPGGRVHRVHLEIRIRVHALIDLNYIAVGRRLEGVVEISSLVVQDHDRALRRARRAARSAGVERGRPGRLRAIHPRKCLPGGEAKSGVIRDDEDDGAENTHRCILRVYCNRSKRFGGHCDDGDNDGSLSDWFRFNFKDQFHAAAVD